MWGEEKDPWRAGHSITERALFTTQDTIDLMLDDPAYDPSNVGYITLEALLFSNKICWMHWSSISTSAAFRGWPAAVHWLPLQPVWAYLMMNNFSENEEFKFTQSDCATNLSLLKTIVQSLNKPGPLEIPRVSKIPGKILVIYPVMTEWIEFMLER